MDSERKVAAEQGRPGEDDLLGVIADVEKQLASLKQVKAEREEERQRVADRERAVKDGEAALAERARQVSQRESDAAAAAKTLQQASALAEKREADLNSRTATIQEREGRLAENSAAASRERQAMDARAAELTEKENKLRTVATELERERKRAAGETEAAQKRAEEAKKAAESAAAEAARAGEAKAAAERKLSERSAELERAAGRVSAAEQQIETLKGQVGTRDSRINDLSDKLQNATVKFREVSQTLKEQAQMLGQATALAEDRKAKEQRIAELEAKLSGAGESTKEAKALRERVAELEAKLKEAKASGTANAAKESKALKERIVALEAELRSRPAGGSEDTATLRQELEQTLAELASARKKISSLKAKGEQAPASGGVPVEIGEAIATRWRRLRLMRQMLQEQGGKLRQASEALRERYGHSGSLDAQRDELTAARASLGESRKKVERMMQGAAKGKAASLVFHVVGTLAALAGIAWAIAGEIAPATYAARAIIGADDRGGAASHDQLVEWSKYHETLLNDPGLIETASDRMKRRGIESLSTPGALTERLAADLSHESGAPGQVSLELRGRGRAKTQQTMEVFVNALVSQSNATTERRVDGLPTMIVQTANVADGAISDSRPIYALGVFIVGFGAVGGLGWMAWKRLASAKIRFEEEAEAESVRENAAWSKPPQAFAKRG